MKFLSVLVASLAASLSTAAKCDCADDICSIVPPEGSKAPCYQGSNADTDKCYATDPLLVSGVTKQCGTCEASGYPKYLRNDPIYTNMGLYTGTGSMSHYKTQAACTPPGGYCFPGEATCCHGTCPMGWQFACY